MRAEHEGAGFRTVGRVRRAGRGTAPLLSLALVVPTLLLASPASAATAAPWVTSDKPDYAPGSAVVLSGGDWQPGERVHVNVDDDQTKTWTRDVDVVADDSGAITDAFVLPDWFVATYQVTATGEFSGVAAHGFTDGNVAVETTGPRVSLRYRQFSGTGCAPNSGSDGSAVVGATSGSTPLFGRSTGSFRLDVPATADDKVFTHWTSQAGFASVANPLCFDAINGNRLFTAHYATPAIAATTLAVPPVAGSYAGPVTLTATLRVGGVALSGRSVAFQVDGVDAGTAATDSSGVATVLTTLGATAPGIYPTAIKAAFRGDKTYGASAGTGGLTVARAEQALLTVVAPDGGTFGQAFPLNAIGGSGTGAVSFAGHGDACLVTADRLHITRGTGTCTVTAAKAGDVNYTDVSSAVRTVTIGKAEQATLTVLDPGTA
ncbi:MAG: hypothetical protein M3Q22_03870, partial [Actinomycetota bacterium]|nr:hypothetical protein [Actinomycetota bacterium]